MRWRLRALAPILATLFWLSLPSPILAHAVVVASDPAGVCLSVAASVPLPGDSRCLVVGTENTPLAQPPVAVRLWFSEPVEPFGDGLWVVGPDGKRVDRGPLRVSPTAIGIDVDATQRGTYLVHWQIVATDTHPGQGSYTFVVIHPGGVLATVGEVADRTETSSIAPIGFVLAVAARWLHFLGYALSFGVLAIRLIVFRSGRLVFGSDEVAVSHRLWSLVNLGIVLLVVAEPIALLGQTGSLGASAMFDPDLVGAALDSSFGRALALRLGAPFLLWLLVGIAREGTGWAEVAGVGLGGALAFFDGSSAHARSVQPIWLGLAVNALHVASMGVWLGGVISLAAIWPVLKSPDTNGFKTTTLRRLGRIALAAVAILAVSGLVMAGFHLNGVGDLVATSYGIVIAIKAGLVALIVILVGIRQRWQQRLARSSWIGEIAGIASVLLLAGILVSLPPPR